VVSKEEMFFKKLKLKVMKNKTVIIIGGTSGIGLATAIRFSRGHNVIFVGRDVVKGESAQMLPSIKFIQCDISSEIERAKLIEAVKDENITKIVHCAGIFSEGNEESYEQKYEAIKFGGVDLINQLIISNRITHVCATSSLYTFLPDTITPAFEKSVQMKLENAILSLEGIVANCVAPGLTNTPLARKAFGEERIKELLSLAPGSRIVEPEEVAETIYWLSNQNTITCSVVPVDGGFLQNFYKTKDHIS
jgi:NAD(P)-dependent dehydrogenase (short-subunit alcohol dehydrogenase family)